MSDSEWKVKKQDWPVTKKSTDKTFTKEMIDKVFDKAKDIK